MINLIVLQRACLRTIPSYLGESLKLQCEIIKFVDRCLSIRPGSINEEKGKDGKTRSQRLQEYIDKVYNAFKTKSVAIVAKIKGFEYEEYTNKQGVSNQSLDELNKMKTSLIDDVANAIGVPTALIYGEKAELDSNLQAFQEVVYRTTDEEASG